MAGVRKAFTMELGHETIRTETAADGEIEITNDSDSLMISGTIDDMRVFAAALAELVGSVVETTPDAGGE